MFKLPDRMPGSPLFQPQIPGNGNDGQERNRISRWWNLSLLALGAMLLFMSGDALLELLMDIGDVIFDFVEETLEGFYRNSAKMDIHQAQMATAYTYAALLVLVAWLTARRLFRFLGTHVRRLWTAIEIQRNHGQETCRSYAIYFGAWWDSRDRLSRAAFAVAVLMGVIPLFLVISIGLGMAVADMF